MAIDTFEIDEEGVFSDGPEPRWTAEQWRALLEDIWRVSYCQKPRREKADTIRAIHNLGHHTYERIVNAFPRFSDLFDIPMPGPKDMEIDELCDAADDLAYTTLKAYDNVRDVYNEAVVQAYQKQTEQRASAVKSLTERLQKVKDVLKDDLKY